jgi:hypothetical protein
MRPGYLNPPFVDKQMTAKLLFWGVLPNNRQITRDLLKKTQEKRYLLMLSINKNTWRKV